MATTYLADKMQAGVQPKVLPSAGGVNVLSQANLTTALALNDIVQMAQLEGDPALTAANLTGAPYYGPVLIGLLFDVDALDSGNTLTLDVGDSGSANRFFAASTIGQAGGYATPSKPAILGYAPFASSYATYTTASLQLYTIQVKCHAAPTTWANGKVRLLVEYTYDP